MSCRSSVEVPNWAQGARNRSQLAHEFGVWNSFGLEGTLFHGEGFDAYLSFRGIPTFIDGRAKLNGNAFLDSCLKDGQGEEPTLSALLDRYAVTWTHYKTLQQFPECTRKHAENGESHETCL